MHVQQPRPKTWLYMSQDETAFIQQPSLETWLWGARCPVFRCGGVRHVQRCGRTHNGVRGQTTCTESAKGVIHSDGAGARVGDNHVWVRQRSERWPSSPSSRYQDGKSEYVTKHTTASEDAAKGVRGPFRRGRWRRWLNLVFSCRGGHPQAGETSFCYIGNDSRLPRISRNG